MQNVVFVTCNHTEIKSASFSIENFGKKTQTFSTPKYTPSNISFRIPGVNFVNISSNAVGLFSGNRTYMEIVWLSPLYGIRRTCVFRCSMKPAVKGFETH